MLNGTGTENRAQFSLPHRHGGKENKTTVQIQENECLGSYSDEKGGIQKKSGELAVGGIPATVAITSHIIPLRIESDINGLGTAKGDNAGPTCFQRRRPTPNA